MSSGVAFVVFKALIGFGLPLAVAFHQLYLLKKDKQKGPTGPAGEPQVQASGEPKPAIANQDEPREERRAA